MEKWKEYEIPIRAANYVIMALSGSIAFSRPFSENALYLAVFEKQMDLAANLEILLGNVAIAVIDAHTLFGTPVPMSAIHDLLGDPGGQAIALVNAPPLATPRDVLLVTIRQELFPNFKDNFFESIHAASRTSLMPLP